ncbi:MAG: hypothetical protein DRH11_08715 [Deltaproteobacteria bacterium]|mgnify:CR=1 FL=1|nr:MAG: hypothetical protein DRH11_08715 [Deltaproteobacteria bacterium]
MGENTLRFKTRKTTITIDYNKCLPAKENNNDPSCGFACVKACRLYGRSILRIEHNRPALAVTDEGEIKRLDNECLSCEFNCERYGSGCITIDIPLA